MAEVTIKSLGGLPKSIANFINDVVSTCHKEAAVVMGILSGMGVTPESNHFTTSVLLGYSALTYGVDSLKSGNLPNIDTIVAKFRSALQATPVVVNLPSAPAAPTAETKSDL